MSDHFGQLGFAFESPEQFSAFVDRMASKCKPYSVEGGTYLVWADSGIELYLQANASREIIGMNPHFAGSARMKVSLTNPVHRENDTPLDGAWHGWANPSGSEAGHEGDYPFVFDSPNFLQSTSTVPLPRIAKVQLAAFAYEINAYPDESSYNAATTMDGKPGFASQSFVPAGLFVKDKPPTAHAIFAGHVRQAQRLRNPLTQVPFHHLVVETLGGQVDVVASESCLNTPVDVGHIVNGQFWLSGKILDTQTKPLANKSGFFSRLWKR